MSDFANAAKNEGTSFNIFGVIAIILGIIAMLLPGVVGISVVTFVGVCVLLAFSSGRSQGRGGCFSGASSPFFSAS